MINMLVLPYLSFSNKALNYYAALFVCFLILSIASPLLSAQEVTSSPLLDPFATSDDSQFLPVDQAYRLSVRQTDTNVIVEWVIAENYFLYGDKFDFNVGNQAIDAARAPGVIAYDPIFSQDVEKYYFFSQSIITKKSLTALSSPLRLSVTYQGCADAGLCYPPETRYFMLDIARGTVDAVDAAVKGGSSSALSAKLPLSEQGSIVTVLVMLLFALLGGVVLNVMPCVFPVLSIKVLSLIHHQRASLRIRHAWSYTAGSVSTFVLIAVALLLIRQAGAAVGWGFQLQSPGVITFLVFLFFIMGLGLSGFMSIGARWAGVGQALTQGNHLSHSFFTGMLAVVVASPCTAPFMASALGYALTQSALIALGIFAFLGLGMALPFLMLSYLPQLSRFLPAPGAWMETFKQILAFPLYITSVWLLWVLGQQTDNDVMVLVMLGAVFTVFAIWLAQQQPRWASLIGLVSVLLLASIIWYNQQQINTERAVSAGDNFWQVYTPETLDELRRSGRPVLVNVTADWCVTCKINEKLAFTTETLTLLKSHQVQLLVADWTRYDEGITQLLSRYARGGVPLYLWFSAADDARGVVLPQILSATTLTALVDEL